jgi:iron complex outermembrane recepter protein
VLGVTALGDVDGDPTLGQTLGAYGDLVSNYTQKTSTVGIFGQTELVLSDELSLTTGLRYGVDEKEYQFNSREYYGSTPAGSNNGLETTQLPAYQLWGTAVADEEQTEKDWSGKLQLDWQLSYETLAYVGASKGTKGGGYTAPTYGGSVVEFDQETLYSYEIGLKTSLNDSTRLNLSAFYYDYKDYQAFTFVDLAGRINNQDAVITGAEVELIWNPAEGLNIILGASAMDAEVKDMGLPTGEIINTDMPMASDYTLNALVRKAWNVGNNELALQLDYSYVDDYYSEALNNESGLVEGHGTTNARLSYGPADNNWEVALNVRNLTDEDEAPYHIPTGLGFSEDAIASPRWVSAQLLYRFN